MFESTQSHILSLEVNDPILRKNFIGASDAPIIMGDSPYKTLKQLYREKMGFEVQIETYPMSRGKELEEEARYIFYKQTGLSVYPTRVLSNKFSWMMASMDGLSLDKKIALEIKCPMNVTGSDHLGAKEGIVPEKYIAQLQHQMEVLEIDEMYYMSYTKSSHFITKLKRDLEYADKLIEKEMEFFLHLKGEIEPE